jgi:hypothetical protein
MATELILDPGKDQNYFIVRLTKVGVIVESFLKMYPDLLDETAKMRLQTTKGLAAQHLAEGVNPGPFPLSYSALVKLEEEVTQICDTHLVGNTTAREVLSEQLISFYAENKARMSEHVQSSWLLKITQARNKESPLAAREMMEMIRSLEEAPVSILRTLHDNVKNQLDYLNEITTLSPAKVDDLGNAKKTIGLLLALCKEEKLSKLDAIDLLKIIEKFKEKDSGILTGALKAQLTDVHRVIKNQIDLDQPVTLPQDKKFIYTDILTQVANATEEKTQELLKIGLRHAHEEYVTKAKKVVNEFAAEIDPKKLDDLLIAIKEAEDYLKTPIRSQDLYQQVERFSNFLSGFKKAVVFDAKKLSNVSDLKVVEQKNNMTALLLPSAHTLSVIEEIKIFNHNKSGPAVWKCLADLQNANLRNEAMVQLREVIAVRKNMIAVLKNDKAKQELSFLIDCATYGIDDHFSSFYGQAKTLKEDLRSGKAQKYMTFDDIVKLWSPPYFSGHPLLIDQTKTLLKILHPDITSIKEMQPLININMALSESLKKSDNELRFLADAKSYLASIEKQIHELEASKSPNKKTTMEALKKSLKEGTDRLKMQQGEADKCQEFIQGFVENGLMGSLQYRLLAAYAENNQGDKLKQTYERESSQFNKELRNGKAQHYFGLQELHHLLSRNPNLGKTLIGEFPEMMASTIMRGLKDISHDNLITLLPILNEINVKSRVDTDAYSKERRNVSVIEKQIFEAKNAKPPELERLGPLQKQLEEAKTKYNKAFTMLENTQGFRKSFVDSGLMTILNDKLPVPAPQMPPLAFAHSQQAKWVRVERRSEQRSSVTSIPSQVNKTPEQVPQTEKTAKQPGPIPSVQIHGTSVPASTSPTWKRAAPVSNSEIAPSNPSSSFRR